MAVALELTPLARSRRMEPVTKMVRGTSEFVVAISGHCNVVPFDVTDLIVKTARCPSNHSPEDAEELSADTKRAKSASEIDLFMGLHEMISEGI
jgi:hypothetical protein